MKTPKVKSFFVINLMAYRSGIKKETFFYEKIR